MVGPWSQLQMKAGRVIRSGPLSSPESAAPISNSPPSPRSGSHHPCKELRPASWSQILFVAKFLRVVVVMAHAPLRFYRSWEAKMTKLALIVLAGASFLGTGIASAQYSFGDEGYW